MGWKQERDANMSIGYTGGWCLKYVQDAFGTDHPYASAIDAWNANYGNGNHVDQPPLGITVPVYFTLASVPAGHVAIRLDDGWIASSTQPGEHSTPYYHKSLDDLMAVYAQYNGTVNYLGWSEYVGSVHVVQDIENATADQIQQAYQDLLGRPADPDGIAHYEQYQLDFVRQDLAGSAEHRAYIQAKQAAANPVIAPVQNTPPVVASAVTTPTPAVPSVSTIASHPNPLPSQPSATPKTTKPAVDNPPLFVRIILFFAELFTKKK